MGALTAFDWVLILVIAVSTIGAFSRGLISVLGSLAGLVFGLLLASWNYVQVALWLQQWFPRGQIAELMAFVLILVSVLIAFGFLAKLLRSTVSAVGLGVVDRLLGGVFGLVRGCLLGIALAMAAVAFGPGAAIVEKSCLVPYFLAGAHEVSFVVPEQMQRQIAEGAAHLLERGPDLLGSSSWPKHKQQKTQ